MVALLLFLQLSLPTTPPAYTGEVYNDGSFVLAGQHQTHEVQFLWDESGYTDIPLTYVRNIHNGIVMGRGRDHLGGMIYRDGEVTELSWFPIANNGRYVVGADTGWFYPMVLDLETGDEGTIPPATSASLMAISEDDTIVGIVLNEERTEWTGKVFSLSSYGVSIPGSFARDISEGVVVGNTDDVAWRWTEEHGLIELPKLPGTQRCKAELVSAGRIVGRCDASSFAYDKVSGMQSLNEILEHETYDPVSISPDGTRILGVSAQTWIATLPPVGATLEGDANQDGFINSADLNALALNWRQEAAAWASGDFNDDDFVDARDLNILALGWGANPITPVPESTQIAWLLLACAVMANQLRLQR